jgi:hypothetical protein
MQISEGLRKAIKDSGLSLRQIAIAADIPPPALSYFLSAKPDQQRDIRLATADKLATFFNLGLAPLPGKAKPKPSTITRSRTPKKKRSSG